MPQLNIIAVLVAAIIASLGLWWFRLVIKKSNNMRPILRNSVYAGLWLAYFILVMMVINQQGA